MGLEKLKGMLCDELDKYAEKGELTAGSLDVVDKLTHTIKNINKIIDEDGGYSNRYMYEGRSNRRSYEGESYRRDRMGRYSRDGLADKLRDMMMDAPDERTKNEIRKLADKVESM